MATVKLYTNNSEKIRVSKRLTLLGEVTGTFRGAVDVLRPVVTIQGEFTNQCNYFRIEEFGRYYYVTDPIIPRQGLIELHGEVDVLCSWDAQIRRQSAIVERQEISYNLMLNDPLIHAYQNSMIGTAGFPYGFNAQQYILATL